MVWPGTTELPEGGVACFVTVKSGTGLVTVDVQCGSVQTPVVILAVLITVVLSVDLTVALKTTVTWPSGASVVPFTVIVDPTTVTLQCTDAGVHLADVA